MTSIWFALCISQTTECHNISHALILILLFELKSIFKKLSDLDLKTSSHGKSPTSLRTLAHVILKTQLTC